MTVQSHLAELRRKHAALSDEVESLQRSPGADDLRIAAMKKQKLHLKEQMARLGG